MNKTAIFSGTLIASLASVAIYAAPGVKADANDDKALTKTEAMAAADARFAKLDANADGKLDQADKVAKVAQRFVQMDADKNGSLSRAEFVAAHEARAAKRADRREQRVGMRDGDGPRQKGRRGGMKMLAMADSDGDKAISKAEFRNAAEARFTKADADKNGTVTAEERKGGRRDGWRNRRPVESAATPDAG